MGRRKEKKKEKKTKKPANDRDWTTMIGLYFQCTSVQWIAHWIATRP